jgi:hypothetical protein
MSQKQNVSKTKCLKNKMSQKHNVSKTQCLQDVYQSSGRDCSEPVVLDDEGVDGDVALDVAAMTQAQMFKINQNIV